MQIFKSQINWFTMKYGREKRINNFKNIEDLVHYIFALYFIWGFIGVK